MPKEKLFLSYARTDEEIALKLATELRNEGAELWVDKFDIPAGRNWDREIERALEACDCVLFIVSQASVSSHNVLNEIHYALEEKKAIIPIKIDSCKIPLSIIRLQRIDLSVNYKHGFITLLKELNLSTNFLPNQKITITDEIGNDMFVNIHDLYNLGLEYYNKGNYPKAFELFNKAAANGNSLAMCSIGTMFQNGEAVAHDDKKAMNWYKKAAGAGHVPAMYNIGSLYYTGLGVPQDYKKAMEWFKKAADAGDYDAMFLMGFLNNNALGVPQNNDLAREWFRKAALGGHKAALKHLNVMNEKSEGVSEND